MKQYSKKLLISLFVLVFMSAFFSDKAHSMTFEQRMEAFDTNLSDVAQRYIGIPYKFGGNPEKTGAADNSHLLCEIYNETAKISGLKFIGYMPMYDILNNALEVQRFELKNGDLMVLNDGHAAMIYRFRNQNDFKLIYASLIKQQVISFHSQNVVFDAYWLKNLKGFFRITQNFFTMRD